MTRNKSEKKINSLLDYVSASPNMQLLQDFYATTLSALQARGSSSKSLPSVTSSKAVLGPGHGRCWSWGDCQSRAQCRRCEM